MPNNQAPILFLPHGGGPLPLLDDPGHHEMTEFLRAIPQRLGQPEAILVISAHWETEVATVTTAAQPELIYDYYGFPEESYSLTYPAPGQPALARQIIGLLEAEGIDARGANSRGFDHGLFVPLKLMYPDADIPCVQLSLVHNLGPDQHLAIGRALAPLRDQNILVVGSGLSFHNMRLLINQDDSHNADIDRFHDWLTDTCSNPQLDTEQRQHRLSHWAEAPAARLCHPREEHLLPLHVCAAMAGLAAGEVVFDGPVMGRRAIAVLW